MELILIINSKINTLEEIQFVNYLVDLVQFVESANDYVNFNISDLYKYIKDLFLRFEESVFDLFTDNEDEMHIVHFTSKYNNKNFCSLCVSNISEFTF